MSLTIRALLLALALFALVSLVQTLRLGVADARAEAAELRAQALAGTAAEWEASTYTLATSLAQCQAQWSDVRVRGDAALAQAQRQRDIALDALDQWRSRWDARAADCSAALAATDAACAALEDY